MSLLYIKALHVISMVVWFSGLFYIGRLYVYYNEAAKKDDPDRTILTQQFGIMMRRLWYGITWPGFLSTLIFGLWMVHLTGVIREGWFHLKLLFILGLVAYHWRCGALRKKLISGQTFSSFKLRLFNEIPVLFLFAIIFTVYLKQFFSGIWGATVLIGLSILIVLGIVFNNKLRNKKS